MYQERRYSILFLCLFSLLFPCPLKSLQGKDDSAWTPHLGLYFPILSVKNITFLGDFSLMNEPLQFLSGSAIVFHLPVPSPDKNANSSVQGCNGPVFFLSSKKLLLSESVLAAEEFGPLLVSNDLLKFKNGGLLAAAVFYNKRNRCLAVCLLYLINHQIKMTVLSAKFSLENQLLPFQHAGFSASMENQNNTILLKKNWIFQIFRPDTSQFENYGNKDIVLAVYTPVLAVISLFSAFWSYLKKLFRGNKDAPPNPFQDSTISNLLAGFRKFKYSELSSVTKYFHKSELLGDGIVASVYRASFPGSTSLYAVKRFNQNFSSMKCYETEVRTIHRLHHQNILKLRGWCNEKPNEPLLVYDYMPNRSLYDVFSSGKILLWPHRYNIAVGLAKALVYIHHDCDPPVIHSDIKEENVLLDAELNPKLADFGLSLSGSSYILSAQSTDESPSESQPQEWVTPKIDVFLYGSLVLELCCRRTEGYMDFIRNLRNLKFEGRLLEAADEKLGGKYNEEEMLRLLNVGIDCVDEEIAKRPSMEEVLQILLCEGEEEEEDSPSLIIEINE